MAWDGRTERRARAQPVHEERRGALWSTLGGVRLNSWEGWESIQTHPARLRPEDLENPSGWRARLVAWLMKQH